MNSIDILVFAPHPDDAEMCCGGFLLKARDAGKKIVVVDLTQGEMGTRGSVAIRRKEAAAASKLMCLVARENLGLPDGHLQDNDILRVALVKMMRKYRPEVVLVPHWEDQHPDHAAVGQAGIHAAFLAGVPKFDAASARGIATQDRLPYRPRQILHYNNRYGIDANVVVDISTVMDAKYELVKCFGTQFGPGPEPGKSHKSSEPQTKLSSDQFFDWLKGLHSFYGMQAGVKFGEAYCLKNPLCVSNIEAFFV